jgi:hypothetical protein
VCPRKSESELARELAPEQAAVAAIVAEDRRLARERMVVRSSVTWL